MANNDEMRAYLDWWIFNGSASDMAAAHPSCACEAATPTNGGFGPVADCEIIRYFVVSRSDLDLKRAPNKGITSAIFNRAFNKGVSTARLQYASRDELNSTASILYEIQVEEAAEYGGIMGVLDFRAAAVRRVANFDFQLCCVLDTPLEGRSSHADVVISIGDVDPETKKGIKLALFNAVGGASAFKRGHEVADCDIHELRPSKCS